MLHKTHKYTHQPAWDLAQKGLVFSWDSDKTMLVAIMTPTWDMGMEASTWVQEP